MEMGMPVQPFITTNATKQRAIDELALAFERRAIKILDDDTLINELEAYTQERLPGGAIRYGAPPGMHDDCVMALAIGWYGASGAGTEDAAIYTYEEPVSISPY